MRLKRSFEQGRVLLLVDGWDERSVDHDQKLREALADWEGPRLVASRVVGHSSALLPQAPRWQLTPLDDLDGARQLILNWFGQDKEVGRDLVDAVSQKPQLVSLVRVPLLGALVCWLRPVEQPLDPASRPDVPVGPGHATVAAP